MKRVATTDKTINQLQNNVAEAIQTFAGNPLLKGTIVSVSLAVGVDNLVQHGLDRKPQGWLVVDLDTQAIVWSTQTSNSFPSSTLALRCSASCRASILIF